MWAVTCRIGIPARHTDAVQRQPRIVLVVHIGSAAQNLQRSSRGTVLADLLREITAIEEEPHNAVLLQTQVLFCAFHFEEQHYSSRYYETDWYNSMSRLQKTYSHQSIPDTLTLLTKTPTVAFTTSHDGVRSRAPVVFTHRISQRTRATDKLGMAKSAS